MNISEATAVNRVLNSLLELRDNPHLVLGDEVAAAAISLADRANAALDAGVNGDIVRRRWPKPAGWTRKDIKK